MPAAADRHCCMAVGSSSEPKFCSWYVGTWEGVLWALCLSLKATYTDFGQGYMMNIVSYCWALFRKALRLHSSCLGIPRGSSGSDVLMPTALPGSLLWHEAKASGGSSLSTGFNSLRGMTNS